MKTEEGAVTGDGEAWTCICLANWSQKAEKPAACKAGRIGVGGWVFVFGVAAIDAVDPRSTLWMPGEHAPHHVGALLQNDGTWIEVLPM